MGEESENSHRRFAALLSLPENFRDAGNEDRVRTICREFDFSEDEVRQQISEYLLRVMKVYSLDRSIDTVSEMSKNYELVRTVLREDVEFRQKSMEMAMRFLTHTALDPTSGYFSIPGYTADEDKVRNIVEKISDVLFLPSEDLLARVIAELRKDSGLNFFKQQLITVLEKIAV